MSLRNATRAASAKRMLVFFPEDKSTSILSTSKVQSISSGNRLEEGAEVIINFNNVPYEASVIKLHGKLSQFIFISFYDLLDRTFTLSDNIKSI